MPTGMTPDMLVVVDAHPASMAGVRIAQRYARGTVALTSWNASAPDIDAEVLASIASEPTVMEALKNAAQRRIAWIALRRDFAEPERLLTDLLVATAQNAGGDLPGFAVFLAHGEPGPFRRVLAVVDRRGGPISGLLAFAAVAVADKAKAVLDVLVLAAPGESAPTGSDDELLAVSREQDLYDRAIERSRQAGITVNWIAAESTKHPWELVADQLQHGDYDLVIDDLGDISLRRGLGVGGLPPAVVAAGQPGEIPIRLLTETSVPLLLVIDEIRLGMAPAALLKAGTAAALTLGAVTTVATGAGSAVLASPDIAIPGEANQLVEGLEEALAPEEDRKGRQLVANEASRGGVGATGTMRASPAAAVGTGAMAARASSPTAEGTSTEQAKAARAKAAEARATKGKAAADKKAASPKPPKGGASAADLQKAQRKAAQVRATLESHKRSKAKAAAAAAKADADLEKAQSEAESALAELEAASMSYTIAAEHVDATAEESTGISGVLPGAPTEEDEQTAQLLEEAAQERLDKAITVGERSLETLADAEKDVDKSKEALAKSKSDVAEAAADYTMARRTVSVYQESLAEAIEAPCQKGTYRLTARFGQSGARWSSGVHTGLDFAGSTGTPIYAANSGKVVEVGYAGPYGQRVVIDHGGGYKTTYNHMSSTSVSDGQQVSTGDRIGGMGSTGNSTGTHLHFEVLRNDKFIDPESWLGW